jgi:ethanolamine utilization protein EutA (predicted chaperonin)
MCQDGIPEADCLCQTDHSHMVSRALTMEDPPSYEQLVETIEALLRSATPHPVEHPTMTAAWANARAVLKRLNRDA